MVHELLMSVSDADVEGGAVDDGSERMALVGKRYPVALPYVTVAFNEPNAMERFMSLRAVHIGHLMTSVGSHLTERQCCLNRLNLYPDFGWLADSRSAMSPFKPHRT